MIAAAKIAGPHIDWAGLSPLHRRVSAARCVVLMLGLLRSRAMRETAVPALSIATPRRSRSACRSGSGASATTSSPARCASTS